MQILANVYTYKLQRKETWASLAQMYWIDISIVKLKISANARCQRLVLCTSQCQWCSIDYLGIVIDFLCRFGHLISWSLVAIQGLIVALCSTLELLYSLSLGDFLVSSSRSLSLSFCRSA